MRDHRKRKLYLLTGASGHLGTALLDELLRRGERVRCLVLPGEENDIDNGAEIYAGDVRDEASLVSFFSDVSEFYTVLLHCAGRITIATRPDPLVWDVNVRGTENVLRRAFLAGVDRVICVSSVHAIPEMELPGSTGAGADTPKAPLISEASEFSPELVHGQYAKSKAEAARLAMEYARAGLDLSIVHPSALIGPGDTKGTNHMVRTIRAMAAGKIRAVPEGGYDLVDSRDVALGILSCADLGRRGECYILSGHYISLKDLLNTVSWLTGKDRPASGSVIPGSVVRAAAPVCELLSSAREAPLLTPTAVRALLGNSRFSHKKASEELGYRPRDIRESIRDSL